MTLGHATNNVAEYRGLLLGLERAAALGATEVEVVNDSELVAKQVGGAYKVKNAELKGLHAAAREALARFGRWTVRSVPRAENAAADALVNRALDGDEVAPAAPLPEQMAAGGTDYASYLFIDDLLRLQKPITPGAHDELLFIVVHQAYELWFKLILHELTAARDDLLAARPHVAAPRLRRVVAVERLLLDQLDVLETMGPEGFLEFRDPLAPASGFQSRQFREIEWLSGERGTWPGGGDPPPGPSLYEAFRSGLGLPEDERRGVRRSPTSTATTPATRCARPGTTSRSCSSTTTSGRRCGAITTRSWPPARSGPGWAPAGRAAWSTCGARSPGATSRSSGRCASSSDGLQPSALRPMTGVVSRPSPSTLPEQLHGLLDIGRALRSGGELARCSPRSPPGCCGRPTSRPWSSTCAARSGTTSRSSSRSGRRTTPTRR